MQHDTNNTTKAEPRRRETSALSGLVSLRCWWFGCEGRPQDPAPPDYPECMHCGGIVPYGDMVGDTRHNRFKAWAQYWLWRKWWPEKCADCGRRWRTCNESVDHDDIPF